MCMLSYYIPMIDVCTKVTSISTLQVTSYKYVLGYNNPCCNAAGLAGCYLHV